MAPEVMNCGLATTSSDMWSVGVVAYMLLSGGKSPFYCGSRYRTMARSLSCEYDLGIPEMEHISPQAKDLVTKLLVIDSTQRYGGMGLAALTIVIMSHVYNAMSYMGFRTFPKPLLMWVDRWVV